ncbi:hypothetical protein DCAR_0313586 [Daucus carota subsp. sativus]|uniref:Pentacotripeptide-repeat region of PRORP domain-containing protein n=2 Tax=Daucus carota subsp. sativus TaxID=79200 RepID=A0AAF0WTN8_DAUCS|nr:hypothetical protein DCAR_0313586 [Daucus carota subsp. sativus]
MIRFLNPNHIFIRFFHKQVQETPLSPLITPTILNSLITKSFNYHHATQIHSKIITTNLISGSFVFNNLLNLYAKCGHLDQSLTLFENTQDEVKDVVTYTSVITHLSKCSEGYKALIFFKKMIGACVLANEFTFSAVLPVCGQVGVVFNGEQVHSLICKHGVAMCLFVGSALVNMYGKCGDMGLAKKVFDEMPKRNLVSWDSMISRFLGNKMYVDAVGVFKEVLGGEFVPGEVTFSSVLSACGNMGSLDFGRQVHGVVVKYGLVSLAYVKNSLMDMYIKCGLHEDAYGLFQIIEERDAVTWNVIVMGFVQKGNFEEAWNLFGAMRRKGISPDDVMFSTVLHAAASIAAFDQGSLVHNQVIKTGFGHDLCTVRSLIKMYAKCGSLTLANRVFVECESKNMVTWTTMISSFQQHGCAHQAIELFKNMLEEGIKPSYITFVSVLSACSHTGRVDEGFYYFNAMSEQHNINPGHEHYACMVDLLSRAGRLGEAKNFVDSMPIKPGASVWGALLGACNRFGNLEMGVEVAERLFVIEPHNPGNYVLLSNIYTCKGRLKEASEVRRLMRLNQVSKKTGYSWIDSNNQDARLYK